MKLPGFLKRNKDDDEDDEDDEDFEGFDDEPKTRVIDDDDDPEMPPVTPEQFDETDEMDMGDAPDDEPATDVLDNGDAPDTGGEDTIGEPAPDVDIDFGDDDFDDDFDDDDDDDDDDDEEEGGARPPLLFIILGAVVLLGGVLGGATFWFLNSGDDPEVSVAESSSSGTSVGMALPPKLAQKPAGQTDTQSAVVAGQSPATAKPKPASIVSALGAGGLNARAGAAAGPRQGLIIPSVTAVSYQAIADIDKVIPLATAPDKRLVEDVAGLPGKLPIVGKGGRKPWEMYRRPMTATGDNPKVAIVVGGLGLSRAATIAAIKKLPSDITLAFSPYARDLNDWLLRARLAGHEVFMELPMESKNFPEEDAGPLSLNSNLQVATNIKRLLDVMSRMEGYVGLMSVMGSKFMDAEGQLKPVLKEIEKRGVMFVDGTGGRTAAPRIAAEIGLPKAFVNVTLDDPPERQSLDRKLKSLESILKKQPYAVAVVHAYPSTIQRLNIWLKTMEQRKMSLVPLSAIADKQFVE